MVRRFILTFSSLRAATQELERCTVCVYLAPAVMVLNTIDGQADHLNVALSKLWTQRGGSSELGGADGRVVLRVREQDAPATDRKR